MVRRMLALLPLTTALFPFMRESNGTGFPKKTYVYKTVGNCRIQADVYRATDKEVRPGILWIHGGALIFGHRGNINKEQLGRYLKAGYVVVCIDYRLAPETKLPAILEDLEDAYRWVRSEGQELFRVDPDRISVVGHSAGGYLTLTAGYRLRPRPRSLVSFYGYGDITGEWYSRPDPFYLREPAVPKDKAYQSVGHTVLSEALEGEQRSLFYLYCRQQGLWPKEVAGHDPDAEPKAFDPFCPVRNISRDYPPTLLLHGDKDTDVPFEQSAEMARNLKQHGIEHRLIRMAGGGHGFDNNLDDARVASAFEQVITFLKEHTQ